MRVRRAAPFGHCHEYKETGTKDEDQANHRRTRSTRSMKALVKQEAAPGLWLVDVPRPEVGINDVLIRVDRTGICGTDVHIYKWDEWARRTIPVPMVVGHEFVGEIVEVGDNV